LRTTPRTPTGAASKDRRRARPPKFIFRSALLALALGSASLCLALAAQSQSRPPHSTFTTYGGSPDQSRYSSLDQINRANVRSLQVAWSYDTGESGGLQTQPIVVDGTLYGLTPSHKAFALDAGTGRHVWTFDPGVQSRGANRGVTFWSGPGGEDARLFVAADTFIYAVDARSGTRIETFGIGGRIDLRADLGRDPGAQSVRLTTPGVVYRDLLIVGGRISEGLPASPGDIRAYDVRTGKLRWSFHTIPHPGEFGHGTWPKQAWTYSGASNNWAGMAVDERRGIVYVPTGSAAADFYAANRAGDNLFSNSLIALNAETGRRLWHFQTVRHDIWDRDLPSPPNLVTVRQGGRTIDAVAQTSKHGFIFLFDRVSGRPLFPIEYRKFPRSDVPGERAAETQPIPTRPRPFARQQLTEADLTTRTPAVHEWAVREFRTFRGGGLFVPLAVGAPTVIFPGFDGGAEWGGAAVDVETAWLYVNANDLAWTGALAPAEAPVDGRALYRQHCAACHRDDLAGAPPQIPALAGIGARRTRPELTATIRNGAGRMAGFPALPSNAIAAIVEYLVTGRVRPASSAPAATVLPYRFTGYKKFLDPDGYPAVRPPWGTLSAVDLNTGEYAWQRPLGEYPALVEQGLRDTGTENYGGPIVTAGGLVFIGATNYDRKFRALDKTTGALLWESILPFAGNATPVTYEAGGRQFVVIAAGGGKSGGPSGGIYIAFTLPP
jgi:quinoprotein glucose dehydrogenase